MVTAQDGEVKRMSFNVQNLKVMLVPRGEAPESEFDSASEVQVPGPAPNSELIDYP